MKQFLRLGSFLFLFLFSCQSNDKVPPGLANADDLNAGSNFIRATLDGDYARARNLILPDSINLELLNVYERSYKERMSASDKRSYKEASINVHSLDSLNDSTSVLRYSNSYFKKDTHQIRIVRLKNQWLVDFKSYFEEKKDSASLDHLPQKDSIQ